MKHSSSRSWRVSVILSVGLVPPWLASPAHACGQLPRVIQSSYPAPGATGVPTNVVLYAAGEQISSDGPSLETAAGVRVPITVSRAMPIGFDITPAIALDPNEHYVLRHPGVSLLAAGPLNTSVEFETGSGPAEPAVLPPPELDRAAVLNGVESPCPNQRLCLEPGGSDSALFATAAFGTLSNTLSERGPGSLTGAYGNASIPEDCLQVWRRDALGNRSDVVELCGADVTRVELSGEAASMTCEEYRNSLIAIGEPDDPGCTLTVLGASPSSRGALGALFGLLAVLGLKRRRRSAGLGPGASAPVASLRLPNGH